jgi:hypothetical protein
MTFRRRRPCTGISRPGSRQGWPTPPLTHGYLAFRQLPRLGAWAALELIPVRSAAPTLLGDLAGGDHDRGVEGTKCAHCGPPDLVSFVESAGLAAIAYGPDSQELLEDEFVRNFRKLENPIGLAPAP